MNWFHRHGPWDIVGAYCDGHSHYVDRFGHVALTHLALKCRSCGAIKDKTIVGWYSIEKLTGEDMEVSKVLAQLEGK